MSSATRRGMNSSQCFFYHLYLSTHPGLPGKESGEMETWNATRLTFNKMTHFYGLKFFAYKMLFCKVLFLKERWELRVVVWHCRDGAPRAGFASLAS